MDEQKNYGDDFITITDEEGNSYELEKLSEEDDYKVKASSLIVKNEGANRSFKVEVAPPEGMSFARDIAEKYGVTYEMLIN